MSDVNHHFLHSFFYPESVAVVGASRNPDTVNYHLVANLVKLKFAGKVYPVNPNAEEILGLKVYPDVTSIEGDVDLAVVSVPAPKTPDIVKECVAKGVKGMVLTAGGFSEIGTKGGEVQNEMRRLLSENGIRATGPNSLSPINSRNNFIVSFGPVKKLPQGGISFIFQSGLYEPRFNWMLTGFHLYLSKLLDLGNKMDVNEVDALEYLGHDPDTKVIAMHLESVAGDGRKFMQVLKETTRKKPVVVLKSGRTATGTKAASSHTGAIIKSSDAVFDTLLKQAGAIRVFDLEDFFDLAKIFEYLCPLKNNRVAITTLPGGEAVITTDFCQLNGLTMAEVSGETYQKLHAIFPPWEIPANPFDMGVSSQFHAGIDTYAVFLNTMVDDPNVDCFAIHLGGWQHRSGQLTRTFSEVIKKGKPLVTWVADPRDNSGLIDELESNRVPVYPSARRAVRALAALYKYHKWNKSCDLTIP